MPPSTEATFYLAAELRPRVCDGFRPNPPTRAAISEILHPMPDRRIKMHEWGLRAQAEDVGCYSYGDGGLIADSDSGAKNVRLYAT